MNDLLLIVPTRGRPHNAVAFLEAFVSAGAGCDVLFGVDDNDEHQDAYRDIVEDYRCVGAKIDVDVQRGMGGTLNHLAAKHCYDYRYLGFAGDDHRVVTAGAIQRIIAELERLGTGLVYGNDLLQGERIPTAVFMTSNIVQALGYMAPPALQHLYLDDSWKILGQSLHAMTYLPDVIIEHVHPAAGKVAMDEHYMRVNHPEVDAHDHTEYDKWVTEELMSAVTKIRAFQRK